MICEICLVELRAVHYDAHLEWHEKMDARIRAAAEVGAEAEIMTKLIGSNERPYL